MKDENKTKKQLVNELNELRNQVSKQTQTDRIKVNELLQDSEKRFSCLVETASDAILSMDRYGKITSWNKAAEMMFGYTANDIVGKPFVLLVPERFIESSKEAMEKIMSMETSCFVGKTFEYNGLRKDGSEFMAELSYAACETKGGLLLTAIVRDVTERKRIEEALKEAKRSLEQRIEERTIELRIANEQLKQDVTERKMVEAALRESEAKYRELVQNANSIILRMDLKGNITFFNEFAQHFFGYCESEVIGRNVVGTIVPEMDSSGRDLAFMIEDIGRQPELYKNNENENMCSNGKRVWVAWTNKGIPDENGTITEILCIGNDITDHKQADEELRETKNYLENIIESSWDAIMVADEKGRIKTVNNSFLHMLGYKKEEVIGKPASILPPVKEGTYKSVAGEWIEIDKEFMDDLKSMMSNLFKDGNVINRETYFLRKDKKLLPVEESLVTLRNEQGGSIGAVVIIRDITDRKKIEKEIQEAKEFLENVFRTSADGIVVTDQQSYITMVNEATEKMLGYSKGELMGKHTAELSPKGDNYEEKVKAFVSELFEKGMVIDFEHSWLRKDGSLIDFETSVARLKDEKGNTIGSVGSIRDITARKQAEKKLVEYQNRLRSLASQLTLTEEKDRRRFATYLHDQIGQALFIAKIKLGTLKEQASSAGVVKSLQEVVNMIDQTIQETRSLTFELSPPILYQMGLEAALEWLIDQMQERYGMTIHFEDDNRSKPLDESILILLFRAVRELLINVSKHAKAQHVRVATRRDAGNIMVCVEDDGVGFAPLNDGSSNKKNDGFGLFSIEERLVSLGGCLEIESETDRGTCVTIIAPLNSKKENQTRRYHEH